jgi:hypothetical protein
VEDRFRRSLKPGDSQYGYADGMKSWNEYGCNRAGFSVGVVRNIEVDP